MTYLLDTDVISELRKRDPDPHVLAWYARVTAADVFVSVLTIGEIRLGIERLRKKDGGQAELLERWLHGLHHTYGDHIVNVDAAIAGLLAASPRVRGWTLVTRNTAEVARTGVALVNPFDPATS